MDFDRVSIGYGDAAGFRTMGQCYGKTIPTTENDGTGNTTNYVVSGNQNQTPLPPPTPGNGAVTVKNTPGRSSHPSPWPSPYPHGVSASPLPAGVSPSPARASTPRRFFRRPFPPPSPAKHIKASLAKRFGSGKPKETTIPEERGAEPEQLLDKSFGYSKNFGAKYELGKEVGRGHFGHTCSARGKKGELKDQQVAVKIISKSKVQCFYQAVIMFNLGAIFFQKLKLVSWNELVYVTFIYLHSLFDFRSLDDAFDTGLCFI